MDLEFLCAVPVLADVYKERRAVRKILCPGFRWHIREDDEGVVLGNVLDYWREVVGFGVVAAAGPGERNEEVAKAAAGNHGKRLPLVEIGEENRRNPVFPKIAQGAAGQGEGPFKAVGADQLSGHSEGMEQHCTVSGIKAGGIVFPDTKPAAPAEGAGRGRPVNMLGWVPGLPGPDAPQFAGGLAGSGARQEGCIMQGPPGRELLGRERAGEHQDFMRDHSRGFHVQEAKRHARFQGVVVFKQGTASGDGSSQADFRD